MKLNSFNELTWISDEELGKLLKKCLHSSWVEAARLLKLELRKYHMRQGTVGQLLKSKQSKGR